MDLLRPFGTRNFVIGIGLAALAYLFAPTLQRNARTVAVKGAQGAMLVGGAAANAFSTGKERIGGVIQGMGNAGRSEDTSNVQQLVNDLRNEREQFNNVLSEVMSTMKNLQDEVRVLKNQRETVYQ